MQNELGGFTCDQQHEKHCCPNECDYCRSFLCCFLSLKPGSSLRFAFMSLFYFFFIAIILTMRGVLLSGISRPTYRVGVASLLEGALIHLVYGVLVFLCI